MLRKFDGYCMRGVTSKDDAIIFQAYTENAIIFIDDENRIWWAEGDQYIADAIIVEEGGGLFCRKGNCNGI